MHGNLGKRLTPSSLAKSAFALAWLAPVAFTIITWMFNARGAAMISLSVDAILRGIVDVIDLSILHLAHTMVVPNSQNGGLFCTCKMKKFKLNYCPKILYSLFVAK